MKCQYCSLSLYIYIYIYIIYAIGYKKCVCCCEDMDMQYPYSCLSSVIDLVAAAYMACQFVTVVEQPWKKGNRAPANLWITFLPRTCILWQNRTSSPSLLLEHTSTCTKTCTPWSYQSQNQNDFPHLIQVCITLSRSALLKLKAVWCLIHRFSDRTRIDLFHQ